MVYHLHPDSSEDTETLCLGFVAAFAVECGSFSRTALPCLAAGWKEGVEDGAEKAAKRLFRQGFRFEVAFEHQS